MKRRLKSDRPTNVLFTLFYYTVPDVSSSSSCTSQSRCCAEVKGRAPPAGRVVVTAKSTAFTVSLNDNNNNNIQLHDRLGRFLPAALQLRSRAAARARDHPASSAAVTLATTDASDVTASHVTRDDDNSASTTTTCADDNNHGTRDEAAGDVTGDKDDVTSEAGTYTVESTDSDTVRTADIGDTFGISGGSGVSCPAVNSVSSWLHSTYKKRILPRAPAVVSDDRAVSAGQCDDRVDSTVRDVVQQSLVKCCTLPQRRSFLGGDKAQGSEDVQPATLAALPLSSAAVRTASRRRVRDAGRLQVWNSAADHCEASWRRRSTDREVVEQTRVRCTAAEPSESKDVELATCAVPLSSAEQHEATCRSTAASAGARVTSTSTPDSIAGAQQAAESSRVQASTAVSTGSIFQPKPTDATISGDSPTGHQQHGKDNITSTAGSVTGGQQAVPTSVLRALTADCSRTGSTSQTQISDATVCGGSLTGCRATEDSDEVLGGDTSRQRGGTRAGRPDSFTGGQQTVTGSVPASTSVSDTGSRARPQTTDAAAGRDSLTGRCGGVTGDQTGTTNDEVSGTSSRPHRRQAHHQSLYDQLLVKSICHLSRRLHTRIGNMYATFCSYTVAESKLPLHTSYFCKKIFNSLTLASLINQHSPYDTQ